jgi:hypothetical protein
MDDQLDDNLKKRISEVFDNFEDASADEGWLLLREKFPQKAKRSPVIWIWASSVAALLLLFLGVMFFRSTPIVKPHIAINKKQPGNNLVPKATENKRDSIPGGGAITHQPTENLADQTSHTNPVSKSQANQSVSKQRSISSNKQNNVTRDNSNELAAVNQANKAQGQNTPGIKSAVDKKVDTTNNVANGTTIAAIKVPQKIITQQPTVTTPGSNAQNNATKPVFANNESKSKKEKARDYDRSVRFGAFATSFFNYARGSSSQLNVGGGVSSDIRLSKRLMLSTGIAVTHNSLSYAMPGTGGGFAAQSAVNGAKPNYEVANALTAQSSFNIPNSIIRSNSAANMVGLDIPVNLTYMFNPQKSDTYISAGLSSGTFVDESYKFNYSYASSFDAKVVGLPNQSNPKSFNSFYFAKTLNLSFGKAVRIGGNKIIVEPFIKYPLEGLGAQQIRFGSSGVNLKFNILGH